MNMFQRLHNLINPLDYARKQGMTVGKGVTLAGKNGTSFGSEPYLVTLGDEVRISGGVKFFTHDGATWAFRDRPAYKDVVKFGAISVGERTFIGNGAIIMPGVTIGKRCIIGAGAVVTHDIPDESVAAGVPARVLSTVWEYAENCKKRWENMDYNMDEYYAEKKRYLIKKFGR